MTPRVLIVDDNAPNMELTAYLLVLGGFDVCKASSVVEAEALVAVHRSDLVLMDLQMPEVDGLAGMLRLKADPRNAGIRFIAFTAHVMRGDAERLLGSGFDGYLTKPIQVDSFADEVRALL